MRSLDLSVDIAGLSLKTPLILASGILGLSGRLLAKISRAEGVGAVTTKSIGLKPRDGYPNPTIILLPYGLINSMGLPNPGAEAFLKELDEAEDLSSPLIASFYGYSVDEIVETARIIAKHPRVSALELNVSCPHVSGVYELGFKPELVAEAVSKVKKIIDKPLFVKLSPNTHLIVDVARAAAEAGADGLTAINTVKALAIDTELFRPILSGVYGGLSGPALKPIALRCVYEIYKEVDIPIVGCGGVSNSLDVVEFILAGASAVALGSVIAFKGVGVFRELAEGLSSYLERKGFRSVREIVGLSHR
ncbi:dihydroorotate dehydrogenase [Candidatus Bathyarchaeota archaeon]|nr:dihydroorotate dehydrogenase [Candidatus Bathyarchaeota archaeon]